MLLQLLIVLIELTKFVGKNICIWDIVKVLLAVSFLHPYHVETESIFTGNLMTLREMVDFLVFVEAFV